MSSVISTPPPVAAAKAAAPHNSWLVVGGWFSLAFAIFQLTGVFWSAKAIAYMGGPADLRVHRYAAYAALCVVFGVLAAGMGLFALSGAGLMRRVPLLRTGLIVVTAIYLLRGLLAIPQAPIVLKHPEFARYLWFSVIALVVGIVHLVGTVRVFRHGRPGD